MAVKKQESMDISYPYGYEWEEWSSLPVGMSDAQVVFLDGTVYIGGGWTSGTLRDRARLYTIKCPADGEWKLIDTPTFWYALVAHKSQLLLVGGCEYPSYKKTKKVYTLSGASKGEFTEVLLPMIEKRQSPSAVSGESSLVVAGGSNALGRLASVEVFKDGHWTIVSPLPVPGYAMKSALHNDQWYLFQRDSSMVFHTSLQSLVLNASSPWETLPETPNRESSAAIFNDQLLCIGGRESGLSSSVNPDVYVYSSLYQSWDYVADLPVSLSLCGATQLPTGEAVVAGGRNVDGEKSNKVFHTFSICTKEESLIASPRKFFSSQEVFHLSKLGIDLIEALAKERLSFHALSGVQLLRKERQTAYQLPPKEYVECVFTAWERSRRPTYPATWDSLYTVLRKMDLGHLADKIAKVVTVLPETEDLPDKSKFLEGEEKASDEEEVSVEKLRARINQLVMENENLQAELDELAEEIDDLNDENTHLKENVLDSPEPKLNRQKSLGWCSPVVQEGAITIKEEPVMSMDYQESLQELPIEVVVQVPSEVASEMPDIPGVEVVGQTSIVVTNTAQFFCWSGYGFRLHIPPNSLPLGVDKCTLHISASLAGQYQLPDGQELVSAFFWVRCDPQCQFSLKLIAEIQHCVKMTGSIKLTFVRAVCSQESLPYTFKKLEGRGSFSVQSSYGSLELDHFSGLAITGEEDVERVYTGSLYYLNSSSHQYRDIHFVVNWDNEVHKKAVDDEYSLKAGTPGTNQFVEFEEDRLTLNIPMEGVKVNGWKIMPLFHPTVIKKHVDRFKPGQAIPHCHIKAEKTALKRKKTVLHRVDIKGVKVPFTTITIELDPLFIPDVPVTSSKPKRIQSKSLSEEIHSNDSAVTYDELLEHAKVNKDILDRECSTEHLRKISDLVGNWRKLAEALGLSESKILDFKSDPHLEAEMKAQHVLNSWKHANGFRATYAFLVKVCLKIRNVTLAESICSIVKSPLVEEDSPSQLACIGEKRKLEEQTETDEVLSKRLRPEQSNDEEQKTETDHCES